MKTLICTVGLPRSGKSTWSLQQGFPIVNPDSIRLALHGQAFVKEDEDTVWAIAKYMVKALFIAGHELVIVDATNTTLRARNQWKHKDWETLFIEFKLSPEECIVRAKRTNKEELILVIERMHKQFEPLQAAEKKY